MGRRISHARKNGSTVTSVRCKKCVRVYWRANRTWEAPTNIRFEAEGEGLLQIFLANGRPGLVG